MLSISILYNFLLITLDTKLFEYSILRALGLNNLGLINLFLIQCLLYAIPAIITGLALSIAGLAFVNIILKQQLNSYISPFPTFKQSDMNSVCLDDTFLTLSRNISQFIQYSNLLKIPKLKIQSNLLIDFLSLKKVLSRIVSNFKF